MRNLRAVGQSLELRARYVDEKQMRRLRIQSVAGFSFLAAYMLTFMFEGQILYAALSACQRGCPRFVLSAIFAQPSGAGGCGFGDAEGGGHLADLQHC